MALSLTKAGHDTVHAADRGMSRATGIEILEAAATLEPAGWS